MAYEKLEVRQRKRAAAMPEVKRLVKKYGRQTITNCLGQLRAQEKTRKKIAAMKSELLRLQRAQ